ncbi:MAG: NosD domain-containing protein [Candidatus Thermoplasmatota archaeon]
MEKKISTIITILILLFALGISQLGMKPSDSLSYESSSLESEEMSNISITNDTELEEFALEENYDLPGNGTEEHPFLLENYTIDGMGENHSIYLKNIEQHFVIRDCEIYNSSETGIKINKVSNFTLEDSVIKNSSTGINIESSENITIKGSKIYNNSKEGIYLKKGSNNNTIINNNISNNNEFGVRISESNHNLIYHNIFFGNENQASDQGDNHWDDGERGGNYWSDYEEEYSEANESINTGIWDTSYEIGENNSDEFPLISPISPPTDVKIYPRDEGAELSWSEPAYSIRYDVEFIKIYRGVEEGNLSIYENLTADEKGFKDDNLTNGNKYYYSLKATNQKYESVEVNVEVVPEGTHPYIEDFSPVGDDIPVDTEIKVNFSERMDEDSIQISVEDSESEEVEVGFESRGIEFIFAPQENLSYDTTYSVTVNGSDIAKNWLERPITWSFTTVSDSGMIKGRVVDEEGEPLDNARIFVDEEPKTFTDLSGEFEIEVPSGNFTLKISREGYEDIEKKYHIKQGEEIVIKEDITLKEEEGVISRWFWPLALVGGGTFLLGIIALVIFFYQREEERPPPDEEIYDVDYEDVDEEEFESWWEDQDSS